MGEQWHGLGPASHGHGHGHGHGRAIRPGPEALTVHDNQAVRDWEARIARAREEK